jgi:hypothetical protein
MPTLVFLNSCHFGQHVKTKKVLQRDVLTTSFPERKEYFGTHESKNTEIEKKYDLSWL